MTGEDHVWPDVSNTAADLEFPIPSLDFGYLDDDSFDLATTDGVDALCTDVRVGSDYAKYFCFCSRFTNRILGFVPKKSTL